MAESIRNRDSDCASVISRILVLTWVKVMMFRVLLLVEHITSTNSEAFNSSLLTQVANPVKPKTLLDSCEMLLDSMKMNAIPF